MKAEDPDPIDNGGLVKYTFVSAQNERLKFEIDPNTGNITTAHVSFEFQCFDVYTVKLKSLWEGLL